MVSQAWSWLLWSWEQGLSHAEKGEGRKGGSQGGRLNSRELASSLLGHRCGDAAVCFGILLVLLCKQIELVIVAYAVMSTRVLLVLLIVLECFEEVGFACRCQSRNHWGPSDTSNLLQAVAAAGTRRVYVLGIQVVLPEQQRRSPLLLLQRVVVLPQNGKQRP